MKPREDVPSDVATESNDSIMTTEVRRQIQERMSRCSYALRFNNITWQYSEGTLTLRGRVSTFHTKQMLQTILREVVHVRRLINQVDVVCASGLSSEPQK